MKNQNKQTTTNQHQQQPITTKQINNQQQTGRVNSNTSTVTHKLQWMSIVRNVKDKSDNNDSTAMTSNGGSDGHVFSLCAVRRSSLWTSLWSPDLGNISSTCSGFRCACVFLCLFVDCLFVCCLFVCCLVLVCLLFVVFMLPLCLCVSVSVCWLFVHVFALFVFLFSVFRLFVCLFVSHRYCFVCSLRSWCLCCYVIVVVDAALTVCCGVCVFFLGGGPVIWDWGSCPVQK